MKKTGWSVSSSVMFGDQTKVDYYDGASLGLASSVNIISDSNCPQIPIVCFGNISTVKSYFGSTGTMSTVLNAIAADYGTTAYGLLSSLTFEIGGVLRSGWSSEYLMPNATTNRVPWVIVYPWRSCITAGLRQLCIDAVGCAEKAKSPPMLYRRVCDSYTAIINSDKYNLRERIGNYLGLLLLLAKDECRKSLDPIEWNEVETELLKSYIP